MAVKTKRQEQREGRDRPEMPPTQIARALRELGIVWRRRLRKRCKRLTAMQISGRDSAFFRFRSTLAGTRPAAVPDNRPNAANDRFRIRTASSTVTGRACSLLLVFASFSVSPIG